MHKRRFPGGLSVILLTYNASMPAHRALLIVKVWLKKKTTESNQVEFFPLKQWPAVSQSNLLPVSFDIHVSESISKHSTCLLFSSVRIQLVSDVFIL